MAMGKEGERKRAREFKVMKSVSIIHTSLIGEKKCEPCVPLMPLEEDADHPLCTGGFAECGLAARLTSPPPPLASMSSPWIPVICGTPFAEAGLLGGALYGLDDPWISVILAAAPS